MAAVAVDNLTKLFPNLSAEVAELAQPGLQVFTKGGHKVCNLSAVRLPFLRSPLSHSAAMVGQLQAFAGLHFVSDPHGGKTVLQRHPPT